jgi:hypothetical protein
MNFGPCRRRVRAFLLARCPHPFARWCTLDDRELGEWGEEIAARYLRERGFRILGRRLATAFAEVDIAALDRGVLVCVEVKTGRIEPLPRPRGTRCAVERGELRWRPGHRCDSDRIARLRRAARWLEQRWGSALRLAPLDTQLSCARNPSRVRDSARVDLVEVLLSTATGRPHIVHHADVRRPLA